MELKGRNSHWCGISFAAALLVLASVTGCATSRERRAFDGLHRAERTAHGIAAKRDLPTLTEQPTLPDYLKYAALNNPGLEAAFNRWKAALERVPQVRSLPDPRFTYRYYIEQVETRVGPQRQAFGLTQMFPWFGELRLRGDVALEAASVAEQRYEAVKLKLFYTVREAYYEYYYLARAIAVVRGNRDLLKYLEEVARTRYEAAAANYSDVIRAQVELGKLDDRLRTLMDLREPIVARLNAALNRPMDAEIPWPKSLPEERIALADEEILTWLHQASPELRALEHEIAKRSHAIDLARKQYFPDITLGLNYIETDRALMSGAKDSGKDPVIASASINLPIWFKKYRAGELEARARHRAAIKARADRENMLSSKVEMVLYKLRDALRKIDLYRDTLLPKAKQSLKATETAFRAGTASFLDLIDAERILLEFELSYERALANNAQRLAELEMLVGREIPRSRQDEGVRDSE